MTISPSAGVAKTAVKRALPAPFEWITIPAGSVTLKAGGYLTERTTFELTPFAIGQYPITNAQYAQFIAAEGYQSEQWWTTSGWRQKTRQGWTEPRFWQQNGYRAADAPVIGVSWYEAYAYSQWLSAQTGVAVTLPTEQQWQRAAQGDDGREFPWGTRDPLKRTCNWARQYDGTTPVTQFPEAASPFGVMDLCGNAWELTRTGWETGTTDPDGIERRIVRGGSWVNDSPITLLVTLRDGPYPADGYNLYGFRLVVAE